MNMSDVLNPVPPSDYTLSYMIYGEGNHTSTSRPWDGARWRHTVLIDTIDTYKTHALMEDAKYGPFRGYRHMIDKEMKTPHRDYTK